MTTLAIMGAGPKAAAIAAKARVLAQQGIGEIDIVVIEQNRIAADWYGCEGWTDGEVRLRTAPEKDAGFPYQSQYGAAVDDAMLRYSWQHFLLANDAYSEWIDRNRPAPRHRQWAQYIHAVFEQAAPRLHYARLTCIKPQDDGKLLLTLTADDNTDSLLADGLVITGPGEPLDLHDIQTEPGEHIMNGRDFWQKRTEFADMRRGRVAVIGGGETAAAIVTSFMERPGVQVDIISRNGTIFTRGESYHENRLYSRPDGWTHLPLDTRREIINRTDRGVFSASAMQQIDRMDNVAVVAGDVTALQPDADGVDVIMRRQAETSSRRYDKVIVAIGFNPYAPLMMLPNFQQDRVEAAVPEIDYHLQLPQTCFPEYESAVHLHVPMLAALAQGPGFPNLSCLGLLSDRVLSAYVP